MKALMVSPERLYRDPAQPRTEFDETKLHELADSISALGLIEPIVVRQNGGPEGTYMIVAGERRWRASKMAEIAEVPVIVSDLADELVPDVQLAENTGRVDLNPIEEARAYHALKERGREEKEIAKAAGRSIDVVKRRLLLLELDPAIQAMIAKGQLATSKGEILARLDPNRQFVALRVLVDGVTTDAGLAAIVEQMLYGQQQDAMFGEMPVKSEKSIATRNRIEQMIDTVALALKKIDDEPMDVLGAAIEHDEKLIDDRLLMIEKEIRRLRGRVNSASSMRKGALWQQ